MKLGLREKLFLISAGLLIVATAAVDLGLTRAVGQEVTHARLEEARSRAALLGLEVERAGIGPDTDRLADELGERAHGRVTIFDGDGRVRGDSALDAAAVLALPTDGAEAARALSGDTDASARFSTTSHEELVFAAHPVRRDGVVVGAVRLGLSMDPVRRAEARIDAIVVVVALAGVVLAALLSGLAARLATHGVRELAVLGRRIAGGDLEVRARSVGEDEVADLGRSLDQLALGLRSTLRELVGERDLLSGILTSMREGVLVVDPDGKVALINPALREMLLVGGDVVGKTTLEVVRDAALFDLLDAARRSPNVPSQGEIEVGGLKPRRLMVRAELLDVQPGGVLVVFYDVTDLRRLESVRRDFVANASHELRTPVTLVRSAAETVVTVPEADRDARERFLGIIVRNAERLQHLIDDLLDLSQIEARELDLESDPVDVAVIAERVVGLLAERAASTKTALIVDVPPGAKRPRADARALEQILFNLLDNAVKYGPGGAVTVRLRATDATVVIEVADHGPGIEAVHTARLFERFYRVDTGRSRQLGGTGLGLSIVKHLAEAMGGDVRVESEVGRGTRFFVELPSSESRSSRPPPVREARDVG